VESFRFAFGAGTWWLSLLCMLIAACAAWYSYQTTVPSLIRRDRLLLALLRWIGLSMLLFTLFEPLLRIRQSDATEPRIAIAIDVSRSMNMVDRSVRRAESARRVVDEVVKWLGSSADVFVFDESLRAYRAPNPDSLQFTGYRSNVGKAIRTLANMTTEAPYGAVLLITDGNHNCGDQPLYVAEKSGQGVYAIGIGDSIAPSDAKVAAVYAGGLAIIGQPVSVGADVSYLGMTNGIADVVLRDNGMVISRQQLLLSTAPGSKRVQFTWTPTSDGIHKVSIDLVTNQKEYTARNNSAQTFVRVQKNKRKILLVAGAPSPDVSFVKAAIEVDPTRDVVTRIQKDAASFYEGALDAAALQDVQAIVLIGYPSAASSGESVDKLAELAKRTSVLFVPSYQVDYAKLAKFKDAIPFTVKSNRPQEVLVSPDVSLRSVADPVMKVRGDDSDVDQWNQLPPIYRTEMFVEPSADAVTLSMLKVGSAALDEPLIIKRERGNVRSLAILGYGIYRWKLMGQGQAAVRGNAAVDVLQSFVGNSIAWLAVTDDERRVQIRSTHELYASGEQVGFTASVQDQTFTVVDDADVTVDITGSQGPKKVQLASIGNGNYMATLSALPPGDYSYRGAASKRGLSLGTDNGRFTIENTGIEETAVTMNSSLLNILAQRTGGMFVTPVHVADLIDRIRKDARLQPVVRTSDREHALYHLPWFVAIALTSLVIEWFVRKRKGLV